MSLAPDASGKTPASGPDRAAAGGPDGATGSTPAHPSGSRTGATVRLVTAIVLLFVPAVVLVATPLAPATALIFVALIPTLFGFLHGPRFALGTAVATAVLVLLVELANPSPLAAVILMSAVGLAIGASALRGWQTVAATAASWPAVLLVNEPLDLSAAFPGLGAPGTAAIAAAVALGGGLWTVLVGRVLLPGLRRPPWQPVPPVTAVVYGIALAVALGVAAFGATAWAHGSTAGWVLLTILLVARPGYHETWRRIVARAGGTLAGGIGAAMLSLVLPFAAVIHAFGLAALVAAVALQLTRANYAVYSAVLTAAIVLLNADGTDALGVDLQRVAFTILGALVAATVVTVLQLALRRPAAKP